MSIRVRVSVCDFVSERVKTSERMTKTQEEREREITAKIARLTTKREDDDDPLTLKSLSLFRMQKEDAKETTTNKKKKKERSSSGVAVRLG